MRELKRPALLARPRRYGSRTLVSQGFQEYRYQLGNVLLTRYFIVCLQFFP